MRLRSRCRDVDEIVFTPVADAADRSRPRRRASCSSRSSLAPRCTSRECVRRARRTRRGNAAAPTRRSTVVRTLDVRDDDARGKQRAVFELDAAHATVARRRCAARPCRCAPRRRALRRAVTYALGIAMLAAARVAERVVERHRAEAVERFARRDLPVRQDEIEAEQEAEDAERRAVMSCTARRTRRACSRPTRRPRRRSS